MARWVAKSTILAGSILYESQCQKWADLGLNAAHYEEKEAAKVFHQLLSSLRQEYLTFQLRVLSRPTLTSSVHFG
jgi:hypothetical protein